MTFYVKQRVGFEGGVASFDRGVTWLVTHHDRGSMNTSSRALLAIQVDSSPSAPGLSSRDPSKPVHHTPLARMIRHGRLTSPLALRPPAAPPWRLLLGAPPERLARLGAGPGSAAGAVL